MSVSRLGGYCIWKKEVCAYIRGHIHISKIKCWMRDVVYRVYGYKGYSIMIFFVNNYKVTMHWRHDYVCIL